MSIPLPRPLLIVREQWLAWRVSHRMLKLYEVVRKEQPELTGPELYERVVARRGALGDRTAKAIVRRAADSFTAWPVTRRLQFRDVVHYLAFDDYMTSHIGCIGMQSDLRRIVEFVIPKAL